MAFYEIIPLLIQVKYEAQKLNVVMNILYKVDLFVLPVRGITCISYNIYHLKKLTLCLFNNDFKVRPSKVTYLGYI